MNKKISMFSLVILMIAAIDNLRNLPAAALSGSALIFFFLLSAIIFLIPTALVAAELSSTSEESGGIFQWVHLAFGKKWGVASIWLQWVNTMVWYPSMLAFIAGTLAYLIDPLLVENKVYLISCILIIFWGLTFLNLLGFHISALANNICCIAGTILPLLLIIGLAAAWLLSGQPSQISLTPSTIIPSLNHPTSWISLVAIMASFLGIELASVHVKEIRNPQRNFPRAALLASLFIFLSMGFGALGVAVVVPEGEINLISGVMMTFDKFFHYFGLSAYTPIVIILMALGAMGTMINWLISPAKGLLQAAEQGFLPAYFNYKNSAGVASRILIAQAILVSFFCVVLFLEPSVNAFYWFLTSLSTELYMLMYVLMFCAALRLHYKHPKRLHAFKIPGGALGLWGVSLLGLSGCLITIFVSFLPPDNIQIENPMRYMGVILAGNIVAILPLLVFFVIDRLRKRGSGLTATVP